VEVDGESGEAIPTQVASPAKTTLMERLSGDPKPLILGKPTLTYTPEPAPGLISDAQRKRLFTLASKAQIANGDLKAWLIEHYGIESTKEIRSADYDAICKAIETGWMTAPVPLPPLAQVGLSIDEFEGFVWAHHQTMWKDLAEETRAQIMDQLSSGYVSQWVNDYPLQKDPRGAA
jgi:hypothetical protein